MDSSETNPNRKAVEEVIAALKATAAEMLNRETEPAFSYFIEAQAAQPSGEAK
jgi:hypothetical protein